MEHELDLFIPPSFCLPLQVRKKKDECEPYGANFMPLDFAKGFTSLFFASARPALRFALAK